jgi:Rod binding domain-containing protein
MTDLSAIPSTAVPASVRKEGGESSYKAALGFEGMLIDKLSETLVKDGGLEDSPYASQISESFTSSLLQGGGLGLAGQLYASMKMKGAAAK